MLKFKDLKVGMKIQSVFKDPEQWDVVFKSDWNVVIRNLKKEACCTSYDWREKCFEEVIPERVEYLVCNEYQEIYTYYSVESIKSWIKARGIPLKYIIKVTHKATEPVCEYHKTIDTL